MNFKKLNRLRYDSPNSNSDPANGSDSKLPTRPQYKYENLSEGEYRLIIQAKTLLDETVYHAVFEYLNDQNLCNNTEGMFPRCDRMTGNYYVSEEYYRLSNDGVYGSIFIRFTEMFCLADSEPKEEDYLGLEVWFTIFQCGEVEICGIDSSSI